MRLAASCCPPMLQNKKSMAAGGGGDRAWSDNGFLAWFEDTVTAPVINGLCCNMIREPAGGGKAFLCLYSTTRWQLMTRRVASLGVGGVGNSVRGLASKSGSSTQTLYSAHICKHHVVFCTHHVVFSKHERSSWGGGAILPCFGGE